MSSLALIAFAQLLVIITGELDLSVGSIYGLTAVMLAVLWLGAGVWPYPLPFVVAMLIALGVATGSGAVNAFFTTIVGIPAFIATLGMLSIAQGLELLISRASTFNAQYNVPPAETTASSPSSDSLGYTTLPGGIPIQVVWLALFFGIFWVIRHRTLFGFRLLADRRQRGRRARDPAARSSSTSGSCSCSARSWRAWRGSWISRSWARWVPTAGRR